MTRMLRLGLLTSALLAGADHLGTAQGHHAGGYKLPSPRHSGLQGRGGRHPVPRGLSPEA